MDPAVRDNYQNLVLLCRTHHNLVDKSPSAHEFTEEDLHEWKQAAEHELREKFDGIDRYTYNEVQDMISLASEQGNQVIMTGIGELRTKVDAATAKVLTVLYQQFTDKHRDYEVAAMLHTASERLTSFADTASSLNSATDKLGSFSEDVTQFSEATRLLTSVNINTLISLTEQANAALGAVEKAEVNTGPDVRDLSQAVAHHVVAALDEHDDRRKNTEPENPAAPPEPQFDSKHVFLIGLGLGVVLSVLLVWAVVWLTQRT